MTESTEKILQDYHAEQERKTRQGKTLLWIFAITNMIFSVGELLFQGNILGLMVDVVFFSLLLCGFSWTRIVCAVLCGWNAFWSGFALLITVPAMFFESGFNFLTVLAAILYLISAVWNTSFAIILFTHKGVKDYMYNARNG